MLFLVNNLKFNDRNVNTKLALKINLILTSINFPFPNIRIQSKSKTIISEPIVFYNPFTYELRRVDLLKGNIKTEQKFIGK
jgi:hypothetical protein